MTSTAARPLIAVPADAEGPAIILDRRSRTVAMLSHHASDMVHMMAAAPEMLDALVECEALLSAMADDTAVAPEYPSIAADLALVRAAITKAKGK